MSEVGYRIVCNSKMIEIESQVEYYQSLGWTCQGGIFTDKHSYYQAMVKAKKEEKT